MLLMTNLIKLGELAFSSMILVAAAAAASAYESRVTTVWVA